MQIVVTTRFSGIYFASEERAIGWSRKHVAAVPDSMQARVRPLLSSMVLGANSAGRSWICRGVGVAENRGRRQSWGGCPCSAGYRPRRRGPAPGVAAGLVLGGGSRVRGAGDEDGVEGEAVGADEKGLMSRLSIALAAAKRERREGAVARASRSAGGWPRSPVRSG